MKNTMMSQKWQDVEVIGFDYKNNTAVELLP